MEEQDKRIQFLLEQYQKGTISNDELQELTAWYDSFENEPAYADGLTDGMRDKIRQEQFSVIETELDKQLPERSLTSKRTLQLWPRIAVAAILLISLSVGFYFISHQQPVAETTVTALKNFRAGSNKAELTLTDGQTIILNNAANGQLAKQGNTVINKTANGEVVYGQQGNNHAVLTNTLRTPRGGQYHLVLADGTGVWLNAGSSITYPSGFTGPTREVAITGEVYFEAAHNKAKPFRVKSAGQVVEVLGTHFNINAYGDEAMVATTLLEGSVRVTAGNQSRIIKPGQQAQLKGGGLMVNEVDLDKAIAWKDGYFDFTNTDIRSVMRQVSR